LDQDLRAAKDKREELVALMANFATVRQRWAEINARIAERERELKHWQDHHSDVQIALQAEVAKKRTHIQTVQAAQEQFLPLSPRFPFIISMSVCLSLVATFWAIAPLMTLGRVILTMLSVVQVLAVLVLMMLSPPAGLFVLVAVGVPALLAIGLDRHYLKSRGRATCNVILTILLVLACAVASFSVVLRLQYPDLYPYWQADPLGFLYDRLGTWIGHLVDLVHNL
jgi:hypothetical protein